MSVLGASCALGSVAGAAATVKPPMISEHFTLLPCNKNTTLGMEGCAEAQLLRADKRLNQQVTIVFELFRTKGQKLEFVKAENSWFTYRGEDCQSFSDIFEGGSLAPVDYANCEVQDDMARSTDLHSFYEEQTQANNTNVPPWP
jgi:uncharacterized protein YecT (DUF1311 family)